MPTTKVAAAVIARGTPNAGFTQLTGCAVTRAGSLAVLVKAAHGLNTGDTVLIAGFSLEEFNGVFVIANALAGSFEYTIRQDPGANPSGTPGLVDRVTRGTMLDLTGAYGATLFGGLQNGPVAPAIAPQIWLGFAAAGTADGFFIWRLAGGGDTTANSWTPFALTLPQSAMYVNAIIARNTGQPVDGTILANVITAF